VVCGALGGEVNELASEAFSGEPFDPGKVIEDTVLGGLSGTFDPFPLVGARIHTRSATCSTPAG
jgi:hypothetical protein